MKILLSMLSKYIPSSHAIFYNKVPDSLSGKYSSGFEKNKSCDSIEWCCKVTAVAKVKVGSLCTPAEPQVVSQASTENRRKLRQISHEPHTNDPSVHSLTVCLLFFPFPFHPEAAHDTYFYYLPTEHTVTAVIIAVLFNLHLFRSVRRCTRLYATPPPLN